MFIEEVKRVDILSLDNSIVERCAGPGKFLVFFKPSRFLNSGLPVKAFVTDVLLKGRPIALRGRVVLSKDVAFDIHSPYGCAGVPLQFPLQVYRELGADLPEEISKIWTIEYCQFRAEEREVPIFRDWALDNLDLLYIPNQIDLAEKLKKYVEGRPLIVHLPRV